MRRTLIVTLIVAATALFAGPAEAASSKPQGVTAGQWVDYCTHSTSLVIALNGIVDEKAANPRVAILTTYADMLRVAASDFHGDARKIRPKNSTLAGRIESLSRAVSKTRAGYLSSGTLNLRGLLIASDPLPDC